MSHYILDKGTLLGMLLATFAFFLCVVGRRLNVNAVFDISRVEKFVYCGAPLNLRREEAAYIPTTDYRIALESEEGKMADARTEKLTRSFLRRMILWVAG